MKVPFFLAGLLLAASPVHAYDMDTVLNVHTLRLEIPAGAQWLGVAAGYEGFHTATDSSEELAIWRAVLACEAGDDECNDFAAVEVSSGQAIGVAYCAHGLFKHSAMVVAAADAESARLDSLKAAEEWVSGTEDGTEEVVVEEGSAEEPDPTTIVMVCKSVVVEVAR